MDTRSWLETLVGFDTTSRNSTAVGWIEAYLDRLGVVHERVADRSGSKANLRSTWGSRAAPNTMQACSHKPVFPAA